jgi:UPF0716 protein FxsA
MFIRLLFLFTLVPLIELFLLVKLGDVIGFWPTVALVVATGTMGAILTRMEGLRVLRQAQADFQQGRVPTERLLDGLLILIAGAVLLTPGLITDVLGFFLLVPPGRRMIRTLVSAAAARKFGSSRPTVIDADWKKDESDPR